MKSWCVVAFLAAGVGLSVYAQNNLETEAMNRLSRQCGSDVLCYFSKDQVSQALGANAVELVRGGLFNLDQADLYQDEDLTDESAELLDVNLRI